MKSRFGGGEELERGRGRVDVETGNLTPVFWRRGGSLKKGKIGDGLHSLPGEGAKQRDEKGQGGSGGREVQPFPNRTDSSY